MNSDIDRDADGLSSDKSVRKHIHIIRMRVAERQHRMDVAHPVAKRARDATGDYT
jgi:hypothetical protein